MRHKVRNEKYLQRLGKNLKKARRARGISQEDLADKTGLATSQIARIETGVLNTTYSTLVTILKALDAEAN